MIIHFHNTIFNTTKLMNQKIFRSFSGKNRFLQAYDKISLFWIKKTRYLWARWSSSPKLFYSLMNIRHSDIGEELKYIFKMIFVYIFMRL